MNPRPQALLSTPSQRCFHTNRKHSLGKSLLFPLGSSCQSEKLPLHPSLNSCGDFSLGSLGLLLAELQGKKKKSLESRKYQHPNQATFTYKAMKEKLKLLSFFLYHVFHYKLFRIIISIISSLNVMSSQKSHLAQ